MKLILEDKQELNISRVNERYDINGKTLDINVIIDENITLEYVVELIKDNVTTITIKKSDTDEVVYTEYKYVFAVNRDISEYDDMIRISLKDKNTTIE